MSVAAVSAKWKPYPAYKPSGVERLGDIPAHWEVLPLKRRFDVQLGKMLQNEPKSAHDELAPYIRAANITWTGIDVTDLKEMWFSPGEKKLYELRELDLLVSEGGDVGRSALWNGEVQGCYFQNAVNRVRSRGDDLTHFLYYWMFSLEHGGYIDMLCSKATISHFTAEKVREVSVVLPSVSEQRAMVAFLDRETAKIDALVAKKERLTDLLQEKRTALITRAVTNGLNPSAPMKPSGVDWLGQIPRSWEVKRLKYLTPDDRPIMYGIVLPGPNVDDGVPIVKGGDVAPGRLRLDLLNRTTREIEAGYARSRLHGGDIVYAIRGSIGAAEIAPGELEGVNLTQDAARVAPKPGVEGRWLLFAVRSKAVFGQLDANAMGAAVRGVNIRDLKRAVLAVPPVHAQREIAGFLDRETGKMDTLISKVRDHIEKLREYRAALISATVTGKFDVRDEVTA